MITFQQSYTRGADFCGISIAQNSASLINIKQDVNQGYRILKNASKRYWSRKEKTANLVANQQYYTFAADIVRATTVRVKIGGITLPITMVDSEDFWNKLNLIPTMTVGMPTHGFIRGRNELGLYPVPSSNTTGGLIISYESRQRDMSQDDLTGNFGVTNNSATVTGTGFSAKMIDSWFTIGDGSDGYWYQVTNVVGTTQLTLENVFLGPTNASLAGLVGQCSDLPEDYHLAGPYFAAYNYYLKRKDKDTAAAYKSLFDALEKDYIATYASKMTGAVQDDLTQFTFNLFGLPPQNMS